MTCDFSLIDPSIENPFISPLMEYTNLLSSPVASLKVMPLFKGFDKALEKLSIALIFSMVS